MELKVTADGISKAQAKLNKIQKKEYNAAVQRGFTRYMDTVKLMSSQEIIRRTVPQQITGADGKSRRPTGRELYTKQPSTPGRLTSRTGRMYAGLREGQNKVGPQGWLSLGNKNIKTNPAIHKTLNGRMRTDENEISAWWSAFVRTGSITLRGFKNDDEETGGSRYASEKKRVAFRYMWENGIKGQRRQYMTPAHKKYQGRLIPMIQKETKGMVGRFNL